MPAWPGILPAVPLLGHRETAPDMVVRTEMDAGPAKLRRRFTAGVRKFQVPLVLSDAQVQALDNFFVTDTAGGSLRFDYMHPRTGAVIKCRFVAPPEYDLVAPSKWRATLSLEVLP